MIAGADLRKSGELWPLTSTSSTPREANSIRRACGSVNLPRIPQRRSKFVGANYRLQAFHHRELWMLGGGICCFLCLTDKGMTTPHRGADGLWPPPASEGHDGSEFRHRGFGLAATRQLGSPAQIPHRTGARDDEEARPRRLALHVRRKRSLPHRHAHSRL